MVPLKTDKTDKQRTKKEVAGLKHDTQLTDSLWVLCSSLCCWDLAKFGRIMNTKSILSGYGPLSFWSAVGSFFSMTSLQNSKTKPGYQSWIGLPRAQTSTLLKHCGIILTQTSVLPKAWRTISKDDLKTADSQSSDWAAHTKYSLSTSFKLYKRHFYRIYCTSI